MQVIEKVKVVPEGYNGAGMNYDGGNRRDVNGKANAGLTLGIIGTTLGALALFGNRRSAGASILGGAGGVMFMDAYHMVLLNLLVKLLLRNITKFGSLFFIYLNFSMDKFIDVIVDGILSNFDFGFMFIVNVLTYIIIKVIDYFNNDNKVPTWQKRCVLGISIAAMIGIYITAGYDNTIMLVNSAILAPVFWSWVVSPILKKLGVGYKDIDNTIG